MTEQTGPDWDAVRRDYMAGEIELDDVAQRHGITFNQLVYHRRKAGWPLRNPGTGRGRRKSMIKRMMRLIEGQITAFEEAMRQTGAISGADIRTLETMTKTLDRIVALDEAEEKRAPKHRKKPNPDLELVRQKLIERVKALETD